MKYQGEINNLQNMFNEKIEILKEILRMTKATTITNKSDSLEDMEKVIDEYSLLMSQREKYMLEIKEIDERMNAPLYLGNEELKKSAKDMIENNLETINEIVLEIIEIDKKQRQVADNVLTNIRHHIRDINKGKNISNAYGDHQQAQGSAYFDDQG